MARLLVKIHGPYGREKQGETITFNLYHADGIPFYPLALSALSTGATVVGTTLLKKSLTENLSSDEINILTVAAQLLYFAENKNFFRILPDQN
jgi:hypothetical protein